MLSLLFSHSKMTRKKIGKQQLVHVFRDRGFVIGMSIIIVFYLQNGLGFSPLASGLTFLPMGVGVLISSLLTN